MVEPGNTRAPTESAKVKVAVQSVALLNAQADGLRAQLQELRHELASLQREFDADRSALILQANEQLVLAALNAESIAEAARSNLNELSRSTQLDALTDTPNRAVMLDRMQGAIAQAPRRDLSFALLFVDLDGFKLVNDAWGHAAGDEVLRVVARRLQSVVRDTDTVSRHGGDEFLVMLADLAPKADAGVVAQKMLAALAEPFSLDGQPLRLSASIGISRFPQDGTNAAELIAHADAAMYVAKRSGPGRYAFHQQAVPAESPHCIAAPAGDLLLGQGRSLDLREANQHLVLAALAAQEAAARADLEHHQQVTFLALVAHELRNPLAPLRNAAELLTRAQGDQTRLTHLKGIIVRQIGRMARLIDDLLEASRGGVSKFQLQYADVDFREMLFTVIEACRPAMDLRRQHFNVSLPEVLPVVRGDAVRLAQVFGNLLDNASRYTPEGGTVALDMRVRPQEIDVVVSDTGIGITEEALPRIFDLFVQEARAVALRRGGLGIGLSVVRELVQAHGGTVTARSGGHHQGSTFVVTLPLGR